jgi:hypothetical protein
MARVLKPWKSLAVAMHRPDAMGQLLVVGAVGMFGLLGGALSAVGRLDLMAIFVGVVAAATIAASRNAVFWFVVVGALVVTGLAQLYLPETRYIRYVVPLASLALVLHWLSDYFANRDQVLEEPIPAPVLWAFAFAIAGVVSVIVNLSDLNVALMGTKNYFQMFPFFLGLAFLRWDPRLDRWLFIGLLLIALLQLPFAAHEYLFLVPKRVGLGEGIVPVDIIAGTFGGLLLGGGANAVLAAFQVIVVGILLAMWKNGALSLFKVAVLVPVLLSPLLLNEAKISVLYLPLMFVVIFRRDIAVHPGKFLVASAGMAVLVATLMTALVLFYPSTSGHGRVSSWSDLVRDVIAKQTEGTEQQSGSVELSRWTALTFWASQHVKANVANTMLGHGMGCSREPDGVIQIPATLAQKKYPGMGIGHTAISALLWETGLVGTALIVGMFASAFFMAGRLAAVYQARMDGFRAGLFEGLQAAMAVLTLSLAHKDFFVGHIPFQGLTFLLIGFIANSWLRLLREEQT